MCFGNKDNSDNNLPAKPAQVPLNQLQQQQQTTSKPPPPPPPPPSQNHNGNTMAAQDYAPPQGPPPIKAYAVPPGPPPSHSRPNGGGGGGSNSSSGIGDYSAPPGPPPPAASHDYDYAPPAGPPPPPSKKTTDTKNNPFFNNDNNHDPFSSSSSSSTSKAPQLPPLAPPQDWETAVPDTSLLPPPPNYFSGFDRSPANNATEAEADAGERWCADYPLYAPSAALDPRALAAAVEQGNISVFAPPFFRGTLGPTTPGIWRGRSGPGAPDTCLATYPPLYSAAAHAPLVATGTPHTIYYEVRILPDSRKNEISLALGFAAPPYPPFRLPGWHRASLAVHGDDGHRYVNDRWGGKTFVPPFRRGQTVGLGMRFAPGAAGLGTKVEVFFTRDGREEGRWDLHEETDLREDLPVAGLEGSRDLCAAVGVFDAVGFEIVFRRDGWVWKGDL